MDPAIVVAVIGVAGSAVVALLNHHLQQRVQTQEAKIAELFALSMSDDLPQDSRLHRIRRGLLSA
jgi:hypothetical protein